MTVTHRKRQHQPEEIQTVNEPGLQIQCDGCDCDLTHSIRIKCADPVCEPGDGVDICPSCFCSGKEFGKHKRDHAYRVVELHSYPIFEEDWGADEELLLLEGISSQGLGNWQAIAEHVGTRTKEEVERHYNSVYIQSPDWPMPRMDLDFNVDPSEFQDRKRRRISTMNTNPPPGPKVAPTSAPGVHEVATFLPGRLEFEHELDNEAEDLVKDLEFGACLQYGGDEIVEDENDLEVKARVRWEEEVKMRESVASKGSHPTKRLPNGLLNGLPNGFLHNGSTPKRDVQPKTEDKSVDGNDGDPEEPVQPPPIENENSLAFKLTLLEMYQQRVDRRHEGKAIMFDRGLLNYKQTQANERKRSREEKDLVSKLRPFARMMTAEDFEVLFADLMYEAMLRQRIQDLQHWRKSGLRTAADVDKYNADLEKRKNAKANIARDFYATERLQLRTVGGRHSTGPDSRRDSEVRELTPKLPATTNGSAGPSGRKMPAPMNLANSPYLHLLTPEEQVLCSTLRIIPRSYLTVKETLVREYARRGGKLRRREARDLVKIDVNKTSRIWDFLVQTGIMSVGIIDPTHSNQDAASRVSATPSLSASPSKDSFARTSPKLPFTTTPLINHTSLLPSASSSSATLPVLPNASSSNHHPMT